MNIWAGPYFTEYWLNGIHILCLCGIFVNKARFCFLFVPFWQFNNRIVSTRYLKLYNVDNCMLEVAKLSIRCRLLYSFIQCSYIGGLLLAGACPNADRPNADQWKLPSKGRMPTAAGRNADQAEYRPGAMPNIPIVRKSRDYNHHIALIS